jgi:pyridinium-3,5-biscarboxylic acid mononucleotide sulfurtransferase
MGEGAGHREEPVLPGRLVEILRLRRPLLVAYSGGVDSSVLLAVAVRVLRGEVLGVIADSPSLPRASLRGALEQAREFGASVEVLPTAEFSDPRYTANPPDRCYFCKAELFRRMDALAASRGFAALAYGENADDPPGARPGNAAAREFAVTAPLREAGLGKAAVRAIARDLGLASADAPSQPCLSSRIPHGTPVTPDAVALVEEGEAVLQGMGFRVFRVRLASAHPPRALVQVAPDELADALARETALAEALLARGFSSVEIDPAGYRGAGLL